VPGALERIPGGRGGLPVPFAETAESWMPVASTSISTGP
jgi:hypothetical protein